MQTDIELVISRFSDIEKRLVEDLGATEKEGRQRTTFMMKLTEVEHLFSLDMIKRMKMLASLRNKLAHGDLTQIPNKQRFNNDCELIHQAIDGAKRRIQSNQRHLSNAQPAFHSDRLDFSINQKNERRIVPKAVFFLFCLVGLAFFFHLKIGSVPEQPSQSQKVLSEPQGSKLLSATLLDKGISKNNHLFCKVKLENHTEKAITGIRASLQVINKEGRELATFNIVESKYPPLIKAHKTKTLQLGNNFGAENYYNETHEKNRLFKNTKLGNLSSRLEITQIVFSDGSSFDAK